MSLNKEWPNDYDSFAEAYIAETEASLVNAYYERPAMLELAGDVNGRRILDAGCGSGLLFEALRRQGAVVTGLDSSSEMLRFARDRLGPDADLRHRDLGDPLPFDNCSFDDVVASLVLHYLEDWTAPLAELHRVLAPGGRLIASVDHPFQSQLQAGRDADYFAIREWSFTWSLAGQAAVMSFWHRPLHAMVDAFTNGGFVVVSITEPQPQSESRGINPEQFTALTKTPCFLFFLLQRGEE